MQNLSSLVARLHKGFNDRDLDAWSEVFDEDVELVVDGAAFRGVAAARAYVTGVFREFPGLRIHGARIVAESGDTIVVEHQILNGDPALGPLRPQGSVCEIYRVRDGRVVAYTSYYAPEDADREDVVNVPSRAESSKLAEEQAALRRVATLVARGVSQDELFAAVNEEVGWLVGADPTALIRYETDDTVTLVAAWSAAGARFPIGARRPLDDALRSIATTGAQCGSGRWSCRSTARSPRRCGSSRSGPRSASRSWSMAACGAWRSLPRPVRSRSQRTPRRGWPSSRSCWRRRSRTPRRGPTRIASPRSRPRYDAWRRSSRTSRRRQRSSRRSPRSWQDSWASKT